MELGVRFLPNALASYKSVLNSNKESIEGLYGLGMALLKIQKLDEALRCFQKILSLDPTSSPRNIVMNYELMTTSESGWIQILLGQCKKGIDLIQNCLKGSENDGQVRDSKRAEWVFRVGRGYWDMGGEWS